MNDPKVVGPDYVAKLLHKTVPTIRNDVQRRPKSLPPRLNIPESRKLLWLESDVIAWLEKCRTKK